MYIRPNVYMYIPSRNLQDKVRKNKIGMYIFLTQTLKTKAGKQAQNK